MIKYIDVDRLRAEIKFAKSVYENPKRVVHGVADAFRQDGRAAMCDDILKKIDSLQQEKPEVDFEKGLADYCHRYYNYDYPKQAENGTGSSVMPHIIEAAKYFYELGQLNSK